VIDINNQQDYFTYYLSIMKEIKEIKIETFSWKNVIKLAIPLAIFGVLMVYIGTLI